MMFVRSGYDANLININIDKNSHTYNSCHSNGTITVYVGGFIFGWTSRSYSHNFKSEASL
jgi:hypothetical protein